MRTGQHPGQHAALVLHNADSSEPKIDQNLNQPFCIEQLTLKAPIATKVVCFSHLLKCLRSLYGKQCGPRSVWGPRCLLLY